MKGLILVMCILIVSDLGAQEFEEKNTGYDQGNEIVRVARLRDAPHLDVTVFPNPSFGEFTVSTVPEAKVLILDTFGKEQGIYSTDEYGKLYVDAFLAGSYSVVIISDQGKGIAKLVVL